MRSLELEEYFHGIPAELRFLVDGMLGGLAKWLRILGQEVEYNSSMGDNALLMIAKNASMTLLTSDDELSKRAKRRNIDCLLVRGRNEADRLAEVAQAYNVSLEINMAVTRCPECGGALRQASSKEELAVRVPKASLEAYHDFWACDRPGCEKVYWKGSHWRQIHHTLEKAQASLTQRTVKQAERTRS